MWISTAIAMAGIDPDAPSLKQDVRGPSALQPTLPLSLPEFKPLSGESTSVWEKHGFSRANREADCGRPRLQSRQLPKVRLWKGTTSVVPIHG